MSWEDLAGGWERWADLTRRASAAVDAWFLDALDPQPGETVLDVGSGTGDAAFLIAERLTGGGRVLVTDVSASMVQSARQRASTLGLGNVDTAVMDAQALELADGAVDAVLCRWTLYLLPDPARALAEMARVIRPGGRVAVGVWAEPARNPLVPLLIAELVRRGQLPPPAASHSLDLDAELRAAGLEPRRIEEVAFTWPFASAAQAWQYVRDTGGAAARALRGLDEAQLGAVRAAYAQALEPYTASDGSVAVPAVALNALGMRPR